MSDPRRIQERELVERCVAGEEDAWRELVNRFSPPLGRVLGAAVARMKGGAEPALVRDLVQETFVCLLENDHARLRAFQWECSLLHYLCVIGVRRAHNAFRKGAIGNLQGASALLEALAGEVPGASLGGEAAERQVQVRQAMGKLSAREQLALRMVYWESLPSGVASDLLGLTPNALSALLFRARRRLGNILRRGFLCF